MRLTNGQATDPREPRPLVPCERAAVVSTPELP